MSRSYCLTSYTEDTKWDISEKYRYLIVGTEICPTTGRKHFQCYIELHKPQRAAYIKKIFNDKTIHIEKRLGTRDQAREYCKKDGDFVEFGEWISGQGHRSDLKKITDKIVNDGLKITDLMIEEPEIYCRYRNGLRDIAAEAAKRASQEFRQVEVIVISGPTGCGKTRVAMEEATYKIEGSQLNWFDGYDSDECILIDEYDNDVQITKLLNLLDGYALRLPVKGSHTYANWKKVYITTNLKRQELHKQAKSAHRDALFRRITEFRDLWFDCNDENSNEVVGG